MSLLNNEWCLIMKYTLFAIPTNIILPNDDIVSILIESMSQQKLSLLNGDIIVIASKVIATVENRLQRLSEVKPSQDAYFYANKTGLSPEFLEIVLQESDNIFGWVHGALLTLHNGIMQANAGVDASNVPLGYAILHPKNPIKMADQLRQSIIEQTGTKIGVIITDSHTRPLRMGTTSFALAASGIQESIVDERGKHDIFGRKMHVTRRAVADMLATAANLLMGETSEQIPMVIIRDAPVSISERSALTNDKDMKIKPNQCMFLGTIGKDV